MSTAKYELASNLESRWIATIGSEQLSSLISMNVTERACGYCMLGCFIVSGVALDHVLVDW